MLTRASVMGVIVFSLLNICACSIPGDPLAPFALRLLPDPGEVVIVPRCSAILAEVVEVSRLPKGQSEEAETLWKVQFVSPVSTLSNVVIGRVPSSSVEVVPFKGYDNVGIGDSFIVSITTATSRLAVALPWVGTVVAKVYYRAQFLSEESFDRSKC